MPADHDSRESEPTAGPDDAEPPSGRTDAAAPTVTSTHAEDGHAAVQPSGSGPAPEPTLDAWTRATWAWLGLVLGLGSVVVLYGLGGGTLQPYDEGLYGKLARNALEYGQYLYSVGADGELYRGYEKPPLAVVSVAASFRALGVSLASLRLPFALCTLATMGVAFAWGRRIGGTAMGMAWAGALMSCEATFRWGRTACIEPMLMLFVLAGLWTYHEATLRRGRAALGWALGAALSLALAVAAKQVVVALALMPIVAFELWRGRWREALPRLGLVVGLPLLVGLGWAWVFVRQAGDDAYRILLGSGVIERMEGFRSGSALRSLNELSGVVSEGCEPFPWALGVAGLVVLVLLRPTARREADGALLLPLLLLTEVLVFENLSSSMRPWYGYNLVVPLMGGVGFLVAGLVSPAPDRGGWTQAVGGVAVLAVGALQALADVISQLDVAVVVGLLVIVAWRGPSRSQRRRRAQVALLVTAALAFAAGLVVRREFRTPPGGHEQLMKRFAARGLTQVHVDDDTRLPSINSRRTYYGPHFELVKRPPWRTSKPAEAYVTRVIWPEELRPPPGTEILRAPGVTALVGALDRPVWTRSTVRELLDRGPITFEAEHMPSTRPDVWRSDPAASGGVAATAGARAFGRPRNPFTLMHGPDLYVNKGRYTADFMLRVDCSGVVERTAAVVKVIAGGRPLKDAEVVCPEHEPEGYAATSVDFILSRRAVVELRVLYHFGEVWFDRVQLRARP